MLLSDAVDYFGSKSRLARALGIRPQSITTWPKPFVPPGQAIRLEIMTDGELRAIGGYPKEKIPAGLR